MVVLGMPLSEVNVFAYKLCPFSETLFIKIKHMVLGTTFKESFLILPGHPGSQERKVGSKGRMRKGAETILKGQRINFSSFVFLSPGVAGLN